MPSLTRLQIPGWTFIHPPYFVWAHERREERLQSSADLWRPLHRFARPHLHHISLSKQRAKLGPAPAATEQTPTFHLRAAFVQ